MRARLAGNEQHHAHPLVDRLFECMVKPGVRPRQPLPVQVDADIRDDRALVEAPVPMRIEIALDGFHWLLLGSDRCRLSFGFWFFGLRDAELGRFFHRMRMQHHLHRV